MITVTGEVAELEFARIAEYVMADVDESDMDEDDLKSFRKLKKKIITAICKGRLTVDGEGIPTLQTEDGSTLTFSAAGASTWMAMDSKKKGNDNAKMIAALANICGVPTPRIGRLTGFDWQVTQMLGTLFLAG